MADLVPINPQGFAPRIADRLIPFRAMFDSPAIRRALPAIGTLAALAIAALAWIALREAPQRAVFEGLGEADKAAIAAALQTAGLAHTIDRSSGSVTVAEDDFHRARMLLAAQGLPKAAPSGDSVLAALPMGTSRAVEGETLRAAREADLARTIEAIDAVSRARIHLAMADPSPFLRDQQPAVASVMLTLEAGRMLEAAQVRAIGHLVASSVTGLSADRVAVVDQSGQLLTQRDGDDRLLAQQVAVEDRARRALIALLTPMLGAGNFSAEVHADIDPSESQSTRESYPKDDRALRREEGNSTSSANNLPAMGIPGALSNTPPPASQVTTTPPTAAPASPSEAGTSEQSYTRAFDVGREVSVTRQPEGRLRKLSVAVALRQGAKPRTAPDIAVVERLVKGATGFDAARGDSVTVAERSFVTATDDVVAFYDKPWFAAILRNAMAAAGVLVALLVIGLPIRRALQKHAERAAERDAISGELLGVIAPKPPVTLDMIAAAPGYESRANLVRDFVRQDPAKAAQVVRELMAERADG